MTLAPILATLAAAALAQDLGIKAPPQSHPITIYNAAIHPVSAPDIPKGFLTFSDGLITEIGSGNPHIPANDPAFIDAQGLHVYPGLVAAVTQIGLREFGLVRQTVDSAETGDIKPEVLAASAINPDSTILPVTRANGVLTAGVFPIGGLIPGQPAAIRLDAWTIEDLPIAPSASSPPSSSSPRAPGLRIAPSASLGLAINWPQSRVINAWWMDKSEDDQLKDIRAGLERVTKLLDAAIAYHAARAADPDRPADLRLDAILPILPSANPQRPLFVFANDLDQINAAVSVCTQRSIRMVLVGGRDAPLAAPLLKEHHIPVILMGTHEPPQHADAPYNDTFTLPARLLAAGIDFAIASAEEAPHQRNLPYEAASAVAHGLPLDVALKSVTLAPAAILGLGDQLGSLDKGKRATLILTDGHPLEITTSVRRAFIDGREIDLATKQSALRDKYRQRYIQSGQIPADHADLAPSSGSPTRR